jgi:acetylornithine deacetylase/succinyl-diaminopimelate desuccinylase-like protein
MARKFAAYYEAHIEQGPILEREGISIGIVTHCIGVEQWTVIVTGRDGHVGSPMAGRQDALAAAAELVLALERVAIATGGMATATRLTLQPDTRGNIPSLVRFAANIRHPDADGNERMTAAFQEAIAELTARRDVQVEIERVGGYPRVPFAPALLDSLRRAAGAAQLRHRDMPGTDSAGRTASRPRGAVGADVHPLPWRRQPPSRGKHLARMVRGGPRRHGTGRDRGGGRPRVEVIPPSGNCRSRDHRPTSQLTAPGRIAWRGLAVDAPLTRVLGSPQR